MAPSPTSPDLTSTDLRPTHAVDNSDLDPAAFLKSVRELSEKREREDAERFRKLEEEVEKSRQERAARRAERARSISPQKQQPPSSSPSRPLSRVGIRTPPTIASPDDPRVPTHSNSAQRLAESKEGDMDTTQAETGVPEVPEFTGFSSNRSSAASTAGSQRTKDTPDSPYQPSVTSLARSGTLSWQQRRPNPRVGGSRPVSMVEPTGSASKDPGSEPTREQISAQLGAREPSWIRQTADRGLGSAAYRKSKDEVTLNDTVSLASGRRGLPGMSRESSIDRSETHDGPRALETTQPGTSPRVNSIRESITSSGSRISTASATSSSKPDLKSLIAADEGQQRASPAFEQSSEEDSNRASRTSTMSRSGVRSAGAAERPASPTKAVGGFVQSALLKRSDSISKRGNPQAGANLGRQESLSSQRSGRGALHGSSSMPKLEPTVGAATAPVDEPDSKHTSSSSDDLASLQDKTDSDTFTKPALPLHSRSRSVVSNHSVSEDAHLPQSPSSPSKRWSPNKSSWIESALQKPESPKPPVSKNSQPSWMANLARAKAERASADSTPRSADDTPSRPDSPTKSALFGQSMLKRSSTKDLSTPSVTAPTRPAKPTEKSMQPPAALTSTKAAIKPTADEVSIQAGSVKETPKSTDEKSEANRNSTTNVQEETSLPDAKQARSDPEMAKSGTPSTAPRSNPDTSSKPQTDFRSSLRPRAPTQSKPKEEPEFLSKVTSLRKTQPEKYVAPDVLKGNILRGKAGLSLTGGPVKSERKDEFKDSLNAKKGEIKKAKEEGRELPGQIHERKTSETRQPPAKPEALTRRETLHRSENAKTVPMQTQSATPEALARHKSLRQKPAPERPEPEKFAPTPAPAAKFEHLEKQVSAPAAVETSKLASRFNPGLAGLLARGPPAASSGAMRSDSSGLARTTSSEPQAEGGTLQDMRKDRAKGPKRRKGAGTAKIASDPEPKDIETHKELSKDIETPKELPIALNQPPASKPQVTPKSAASLMMGSLGQSRHADSEMKQSKQPGLEAEKFILTPKPKPQALPGSAASIMRASLQKPVTLQTPSSEEANMIPSPKPSPMARSPMLPSEATPVVEQTDKITAAETGSPVSEFKGFGTSRAGFKPTAKPEENKENNKEADTPSARSAAAMWGRRPSPQKSEAPAQIQPSTKRDEEYATRATEIRIEKSKNSSSTTQSSPGLPPKPGKSSRVVSGQLAEASPNKDSPTLKAPDTEAGKLVFETFGTIPMSPASLVIDTQAIITSCGQQQIGEDVRSIRKNVQLVLANGSTEAMPPQEEYTLFEESVYLCTHHFQNTNGLKITRVFVWAGTSASETTVEAATTSARRVARENGGAPSHTVRQGQESSSLLQALGGILVTRRSSRANASKQYMLCGRKYLSHIVFDEVDFAPQSLCPGFVYLISFPVTLQETKLYLWKGPACTVEELGAARLAAMDLSETGEIIEVDGGAEFPSFIKIFGPNTARSDLPPAPPPSSLWVQKSRHPNKFATRLFRVQPAEARASLMTSLWNRRPTWNNRSGGGLTPSSSPGGPSNASPSSSSRAGGPEESRMEARAMLSLSQASLEAEGIYILDAYFRLYVLIGPLAPQVETQRLQQQQLQRLRQEQGQGQQLGNPPPATTTATTTLLGQALLFASDYAILATSMEDRPGIPACDVVFSGVPEDVKWLFRQWDEERGLWGTASLMAGMGREDGKELRMAGLEEVVREVIFRA